MDTGPGRRVDPYEGGSAEEMTPPTTDRRLGSHDGRTSRGVALAGIGVPAFACTPDLFPDLMAAAIERRDLTAWAATNDIVTAHDPAD